MHSFGQIDRSDPSRWRLTLQLAIASIFLPLPAAAQPTALVEPLELSVALAQSSAELGTFYLARSNQALWMGSDGNPNSAAILLLQLLQTAEYDGIESQTVRPSELLVALKLAKDGASTPAVAQAELLLSRTFAAYVAAMRAPSSEMVYSPEDLKPAGPTPEAALTDAAKAPSLLAYIRDMGWMHPLYAPLRAKRAGGLQTEHERHIVEANLVRLRAISGGATGRHVFVNTATSQLFMYEDGQVVGSMRVIVGKPAHATPMMTAAIRHAIFKPYWNLPTDYVRDIVARHVLRQGPRYLKIRQYEILSGWTAEPTIVDPSTVNWQAVASGAVVLRVRQLPRFGNAMGQVKYELPNQLGIYLHDTPEKHLLLKDGRHLSMGCIRLEDADRLGRWLFGTGLPATSEIPEQKIDLPQPVPIYITYVTAQPSGDRVVLSSDPYGEDARPSPALAVQAEGIAASSP